MKGILWSKPESRIKSTDCGTFRFPKLFSTVLLLPLLLGTPTSIDSLVFGEAGSKPTREIKILDLPAWAEARALAKKNGRGLGSIEFVGSDHVVISFVHRVGRDPAEKALGFMAPVWFEAIVFNGRSGQQEARLKWEARQDDANALRVQGGFLIHAGDKLYRYGDDLRLQRERELPKTVGRETYRAVYSEISVTPGGGKAFLQTIDAREIGKGFSRGCWVSPDSLSDLSCFEERAMMKVAVAENALARLDQFDLPPGTVRVWKPSGGLERLIRGPVGTPMFLSEDLLLLKSRRAVYVVSLEGRTIYKATVKELVFGSVRGSADGKRFALLEEKRDLRGRSGHEFDALVTAKVYDLDKKKFIAEIPQGTLDLRDIALALSSDGRRLGVLTPSGLRLYDLPEPGK